MRIGQHSHLVVADPAIVVAAHRRDAMVRDERARGVDVAFAVDEIADAEHLIDALTGKHGDDQPEALVLRVDIAYEPDSHS